MKDTVPPWYRPSIGPRLRPQMKRLYESWTGLTDDRLISHLYQIREQAWIEHQYPCIGQWMFLLPGILNLPQYPEILARVKAGQIVLDLGCCFGQDLRLLAADGASPSETQMYASDISEHLWELGFDLFQDRDRMHARFIQADILDPTSGLKQLNGKVDIVLANQFLHLFDWERQMIAMRNIVQLSKPGSLIVGHQRGQETPLVIKRSWGNMYIHNEDSWRRIWQEVNEETDTVWEVEAVMTDLSEWGMVQEDIEWMPEGKKGINFAIRRTS